MVCEQRELLLKSFRQQTEEYTLIVKKMKAINCPTQYSIYLRCALAMMESCIDAQRQLSTHIMTHDCFGSGTRRKVMRAAA